MSGPLSLAIALTICAVGQRAPHDPRTAPTRVRHALYTLYCAAGPVVPIGDLDGDGRDELVVEGLFPGKRRLLTLRAGGTGTQLESFGELAAHTPDAGPMWSVGPDLDGDGARDVALLVHTGAAGTKAGLALEIRSGRTAALLRAAVDVPGEPRALTWIADIDGDEVAELTLADPSTREVWTLSGASAQELWRNELGLPSRPAVRLQNVGDRTGDGLDDLLVDETGEERQRALWISGRDGARFEDPLGVGGVFTAVGDLDGDGRGDLVEEQGMVDGHPGAGFELHASSERHGWQKLRYPDEWPDRPVVELLGDIDGDGVNELGVGDTNFNLRRARAEHPSEAPDLASISLRDLLLFPSHPSSVAQESGCAWVVSGKTGEVLMGVYGEPGTTTVGDFIANVGDQDGDGRPDIAVSTGEGVLVFSTASTSKDPFVWLPGTWTRETEREGTTRVSEEVWLAPAAGRMLGVARSYIRGVDSGGSFEFLRIEREAEALVLHAQPGGQPPTRFVATELGPWRVLFTNPAHDFPTRILYFRLGDELHAHVGTDDEPTAQQFVWRRQEGR